MLRAVGRGGSDGKPSSGGLPHPLVQRGCGMELVINFMAVLCAVLVVLIVREA